MPLELKASIMCQIAPTINPKLRVDESRSWAEWATLAICSKVATALPGGRDFKRIGLVTGLTAGDNDTHAEPTSLTARPRHARRVTESKTQLSR
jgi:hypothetical protein